MTLSNATQRNATQRSSVWNKIRHCIPRSFLLILMPFYRTYKKILCCYVGLWDKRRIKQIGVGVDCIPPASLRYKIQGSPDLDGFLKVGKQCSQDIEAALKKNGKEFGSFRNILDFGCGCGRTFIYYKDYTKSARFYGTDIDADLISWCRSNLDFVECDVNMPLPPSKYASEMFDFIYAISVFTHLNEDYQFQWLAELKRITKPNAIVLLTILGEHCWRTLRTTDIIKIERDGFSFIIHNTMKGIFPNWYQTAYHTKKYIFENYPKYFKIIDYIPRGMTNFQDIVLLEKTSGDSIPNYCPPEAGLTVQPTAGLTAIIPLFSGM